MEDMKQTGQSSCSAVLIGEERKAKEREWLARVFSVASC